MEFRWMIDDPIRVRTDGNGVAVESLFPVGLDDIIRTARLTYHVESGETYGVLRIDGEYVDVGDNLPVLLGLMDSAPEDGSWRVYVNDVPHNPEPFEGGE